MAAFRFALQASRAASPAAWRDLARKTEDLGYSTLYVPDHLDDQWAPMVALTVAAEATTTLRIGSLVLDNDFRHPVVLAKEAATLDVVSGGRFECGMGAGWMTTDYAQSGIPMEPPSVRVARLAESLEIMRAMWRSGSATFSGEHYQVTDAIGTPAPVTPGGPPLVIGGGSRRILTLAGQYADTVSIVPSLAAGYVGMEVAAESVVEKYTDRVRWAKEAAGRAPATSNSSAGPWRCKSSRMPTRWWTRWRRCSTSPPTNCAAVPIALIGTVGEIADTLRKRREELGFSNIVVHEPEMDALAPVIAELAGT